VSELAGLGILKYDTKAVHYSSVRACMLCSSITGNSTTAQSGSSKALLSRLIDAGVHKSGPAIPVSEENLVAGLKKVP